MLQVVGVYEQERNDFLAKVEGYSVYFPPDSARTNASLAMIVRTSGDAKALLPAIRETARRATTRLAVADVRTMADQELESRALFTRAASGLGGAGLLLLFLVGIGLYAVVSFAVGQRTSEIAVRMAVGAGQHHIMRKFVGEGVRLGVIGLIIGLPLSVLALRILAATLNEEVASPTIGGVAGAAGIIVMTVALMATWVPARRAAGVDPAVVLRRD